MPYHLATPLYGQREGGGRFPPHEVEEKRAFWFFVWEATRTHQYHLADGTARKEVFSKGWSEMGDSNSRHPAPKPMSEPSARTLAPSLVLSVTPTVPLWNSFALFVSATAFGFWDLCGIEFCILKVLPTGFTSNSGCFLPQRAAQKLRRINKEINPAWGFL